MTCNIDCTRKWIGKIFRQLVSSSLLDRILATIASPELPKFAEMLLENNVAFITP